MFTQNLNKAFFRASLLFAALVLASTGVAQAQVTNPEFTKLSDKYADEKYETVLAKAEDLIENDKHKKKSEPYLWASMCYYQLSLSDDQKIQDYYKNALKDAQRYAAKAALKNEPEGFMRENWDFIKTLKDASLAQAAGFIEEGDTRKANYVFKTLAKIDPEDSNVLFMKGVTYLQMNNSYEAEKDLAESMKSLNAKYRDLDYRPDPTSTPLVKDGMIFYLDNLINGEMLDSARNVVFSARLFFPLDEEVNFRYEELLK